MPTPSAPKLLFLSQRGQPLSEPPEWAACEVQIEIENASLADLELMRGGEQLTIALRMIDGAPRPVARWSPAGAGNYRLRLRHPGGEQMLDCTVRPQKLTEPAFEALLADLHRRLPTTIAIALKEMGALAGLTIVAPQEATLAEELSRLQRACRGTESRAGLSDVLRAIARDPHRVLRAVDRWSRRERARRLDATRMQQAFGRRGNLTRERIPQLVPERRVEHSVDVYENRVLGAYVEQVNVRLRALQATARAARKPPVAEQARALLDELMQARERAAFLDRVGALTEPPERLTMVLTRRADYRAALEGFLEFRRSAIVKLHEPLLAAPLENLPRLYEAWGTLEVIATFLQLARAQGYRVQTERLISRRPGCVWVEVLGHGQPAVELTHPSGRRARLIPQRSYRAGHGALQSVSFGRRPDIAIEVTDRDGRTAIWIFDPKYKLATERGANAGRHSGGAPKREDINAMHGYRDAIRNAKNERVVRFAAILYPGATRTYGAEIAALRAHPLDLPALTGPLEQALTQALALGDY